MIFKFREMRPITFCVFVLTIVIHQQVKCYKILGVFPMISRSHYHVGHALMKGLAKDGHDVTIVSPFKHHEPINNYTEVFLEHSVVEKEKDETMSGNFLQLNNPYFWRVALDMYEVSYNLVNWTMHSTNFQQLLHSESKFDVVIVEIFGSDALLGLGHYFNAPVIGFCGFGASKWTSDLVGTPIIPSFVPYPFNGYSDRMNFWQRLYNSASYWFEDIAMPLVNTPKQQKLLEQIFPNVPNMPTLEQLKRNVSLVLINTHVTMGTPQPYAPNMIEIGGAHINQIIEPLDNDIQQFLDEAKNGVIYIAFGTNVKFSRMPIDKKNAIANAFSEYRNMRIVIKSEEYFVIPSHDSSEIFVRSWFTQQSILAHPNVKLFITHGGLLSTMESIHFGKPFIGVPVFFDQHFNMRLAEMKGFGISVPIESITEQKLKSAIRRIFANQTYAENAKIASDRFRDQIATPLDTAIHWVKHVAKNKGAPHLRSVAVDLPLFVYYNLDVWAFVFVSAFIIGILLKRIVSGAIRIITSVIKIKIKSA